MVKFSEMLVELCRCMIRINIVKDSNSFFHLAMILVHLLYLLIQHLVRNRISSQLPATLGLDIFWLPGNDF